MPRACIEIHRGLPKLVIDGAVTAPVMFTCDGTVIGSHPQLASQIERAGRHGVRLFSAGVSGYDVRSPNTFFQRLSAVVADISAACPGALIIPRLGAVGSLESFGLDPSEALVLSGGQPLEYPSLASDAWYEAAGDILQAIAEGVAADPFLNRHIVGYHYTGGDTAEWFGPGYWDGCMDTSVCNLNGFRRYVRELYKTDGALRLACGDDTLTLETVTLPDHTALPGIGNTEAQEQNVRDGQTLLTAPENRKTVDYLDYSNTLRADRLAGLAKRIKEADGTKLAVLFYGYHFDVCTASSNHFALTRLLKSPDIDILAGPVAYYDRNDGGTGAYMSPVGSVTAAGKLWIDEGDYRSPVKTGEGLAVGNLGKEGNPATTALLEELLRREAGKCMVYNTGVWWFDLIWNGWYDYDGFWEANGSMMKLMERYSAVKEREVPDICLVLDERALTLPGSAHEVGELLLTYGRSTLYRLGCKFGMYQLSDLLSGEIDGARVYIMVSPWRLDGETAAALAEKLQKPGKTALWIYGSGLTSPGDFYKLSGIKLKTALGEAGTEPAFIPEEGFPALRPPERRTALNPLYFAADEDSVTVLARYENGPAQGRAGIAYRECGGWRSVFYGGTALPFELLEYIAETAGVHRFARQEDVLFADHNMIVLHVGAPGDKTVYFPSVYDIVRADTGEWTRGNQLEIPGAFKGQTVILFYGGKEDITTNILKGEGF